ncbi:hypothetical protein SB717_36570, partial [Priestia sp. SIMBA_032]|uniref:hypothetical protein n=1 Tax=Priestia sp. SIMBA_032 TaxID=3085775 RepID=UPI003978F3CD
MRGEYIDGVAVPDYDDRVSQIVEAVIPEEEDDPEVFNPFLGDEYRMGIANHDGEVYRVIGVRMTEGIDLQQQLFDIGLRDAVG